jgi:DNA-binding protein WhiA
MNMQETKCDKIILGIMRNNANRAANCDFGNITKQVVTAARQIEKIDALYKSGEIRTLTQKLQETAAVRLANPDATYEDLAEILGITKSGVVNRLRKIIR